MNETNEHLPTSTPMLDLLISPFDASATRVF